MSFPLTKQMAVYFPHTSWRRPKELTLYNVRDQEGSAVVITCQPALSQVLLHLQSEEVPTNRSRDGRHTQRGGRPAKRAQSFHNKVRLNRGNLPLRRGPGERYVNQKTRKVCTGGRNSWCNVNIHTSLKTLGDICRNPHTMSNALHFIWRDNNHKN